MFVDFNKVFKSKPQTQLAIPPALVTYLNKSLPAGMKYVVDANGNCIITNDKAECTIGGFSFVPTSAQKKILGANYTRKDVIDYFYNLQEPMPLKLHKEGTIILNGKEFPVEKIAYNPLAPIKYVSGCFYMVPPKFPDPFCIEVGYNKYTKSILFSRIPNNSVSVATYESNRGAPLWMGFHVDPRKNSFTLSISFNLSNAKSILDIVESTSIYNGFLDGKGTMFGTPICSISVKNGKRFDDNSILFWEKVLAIEEILGAEFHIPQEDVDFDTMCLVERLYQNLVNKVPARDKQIVNSIDGNWVSDETSTRINEAVGHPMYFEFEAISQIELFGQKFSLHTLIGIFNAVIAEYITKGKKQRIVLKDENDENQRYTSSICFNSENDLLLYKAIDHEKKVELLRDAKKPYEYFK